MKELINKLQSRITLLDQIQSNDQRLWGVMHPQNVMEHLGGSFLGTAKGVKGKTVLPPEQSRKMKIGFFSRYYPFPKNVKMLGTQDQPATAPSYKFSSLEESREKLKKSIELFLYQLEENPDQSSTHGYFGDMTLIEWLRFHVKHVEHHLQQFGVLPRDEKISELEKLLYKIGRDIQADTPAQWGKMNAHQMIEHLGLVFALSMGRINFADTVGEEEARKNWEGFLISDDPWKNVFVPVSFGDPRPPRKDSIEASKESLQRVFQGYLTYCEENPDAVHPQYYLDKLNIDQWRQVHVKHVKHHMRQFGMEV